LSPGANDQSARHVLERLKDGIAAGPELTLVRGVELVGARIQADVDGQSRLDVMVRAAPPAAAARRRRSPDEPAQTFEHPAMPQLGIASQIATLTDQSIGVAHVLEAQQVRLRRHHDSSV
jgi:hypothetical protein